MTVPFTGHSWNDTCKKCGKVHRLRKPNQVPWNKGLTLGPMPAERRRVVSEGLRRFWRSPAGEEQRRLHRMMVPWNKGTRGLVASPFKGLTYEERYGAERAQAIRAKLSLSMRAYFFRRSLEALRRNMEGVGRLYGVQLTVPVAPLSDHLFSRLVLIEKTEDRSFIEKTGLKEHPFYPARYKGDVPRQAVVPVLDEDPTL